MKFKYPWNPLTTDRVKLIISILESLQAKVDLAKKWINITIEFAEISDPPEITYTLVADLKEVLSKLQDIP